MSQRVSRLAVRRYEERGASVRRASWHGMAAKTVRRGTAPQPVWASDTRRDMARRRHPCAPCYGRHSLP